MFLFHSGESVESLITILLEQVLEHNPGNVAHNVSQFPKFVNTTKKEAFKPHPSHIKREYRKKIQPDERYPGVVHDASLFQSDYPRQSTEENTTNTTHTKKEKRVAVPLLVLGGTILGGHRCRLAKARSVFS